MTIQDDPFIALSCLLVFPEQFRRAKPQQDSFWEFGADWPNTADISPEVQVEVDQIISSFELTE